MEAKPKTIRLAALLGALVLGLGLVLGLLVLIGQRPDSQAPTANPGPVAIAAAEETAPEAVAAAQPAAEAQSTPTSPAPAPASVPPRSVTIPPGLVPASARPASPAPGRPWGPGNPIPTAPLGGPASASGGGDRLPSGTPPASNGATGLASADVGPAGTWGIAAAPTAPGSPLGAEGAGGGFEPMSIPPMPNESADLAICMTTQRVWGIVGAGETVTVSVNGTQMGADRADQIGFFWTTLYDPDGNRPGLGAGDTVAIYHDGVLTASVALRSITGVVDYVRDVVSGTIGDVSAPISVTVYALDDMTSEPTMTSYSQTVSTDDSGNFVADFHDVWDFVGWDRAVVAYVQNGVEVHRHLSTIPSLMVRPYPWNWVFGTAAPGESLTATLFFSDGLTMKETVNASAGPMDGGYFMAFSEDMLETDIVVVEMSGGTVMSRTIDRLTASVDAAADLVTGEAKPGARVLGRLEGSLTPQGYRYFHVSTTADSSGVYTLDFSTVADIVPGVIFPVFVDDAEGDDLNTRAIAPSVEVNQTYDEVSGRAAAPPGPLAAGRMVTLTLYSAADDATYIYSKEMGWHGWYSFGGDDGLPDIAPGDVVTVESEGFAWQGVVHVMTMTVEVDPDANRFTGEVVPPTGRVELSGAQWRAWNVAPLYPAGGSFDMLVTATSPFTAMPSGFDVCNAVGYDVGHRTSDEYLELISREVDWVRVWPQYNLLIAVLSPPGTAYTLTLYDGSGGLKGELTGTSGPPIGRFLRGFWDVGQQIEVGDRIQVQSAAGFSQTVFIPPLTLGIDADNDLVSGSGPANSLLYIEVENGGRGYVPTDDGGQFRVRADQFQEPAGNGDLEWGNWARFCYINEDANQVCRLYFWPQIIARTRMDGGNAVYGYNAIPGNTIYITVTDPGGTVVATGTTGMGTCDWCDYWLDLPPGTLTPNNTVTVDFGDGLVDSMTVLTLTAEADPENDVVTATAPVGARVSLYMDGPNGGWDWEWSHLPQEVGSEGYVVFNVSGEYDIVYGTVFYVRIYQDHGHQTEYQFWLPAPEVGVWKGTISGFARPGGKYVYQIVYWNEGNGVATDTLIVDTLPLSTTYAGDTSGVTPEIGPNGVITWNLGNLPPPGNGDDWWGVFVVTLDVDENLPTGGGALAENCATITTSAPGDYNSGNDSSCTGAVDVWESDVGVNIDKWPNPGDPTPGQEFEYTIRWCTESGANFGPVWLTDTLPVSTTLLDWWTDWPWNMWTEVITTGGQFVLYAPGLPGDYCQHITVRLRLDPDVPLGTVLQNTVVITTPGDVDPNNNQEVNTDARVGPPRYDMNTDKWFSSGVLVPGGWIRYGANWWNAGNTAVHAWLTDTLPPGTSYQSGSGWHHDNYRFEPVTVTDEYAVWDLGVVGVNQGRGLDFNLNISRTVTPGTVLTNCVTVGIAEAEDTPWDNTACITETINEPGPNLRVRKWSWWEGDDRIRYHIQFENIGNRQIDNVWITDTLPEGTSWDGWWDFQFDWSRLIDQNLSSDMLMWQLSTLYPGDSGGIEFRANLDDPTARPAWYTNTVEIDVPAGDVNPDDNTATTVDVKGEVERVEMWVGTDASNMWGEAAPDSAITVTTAYTQVTTTADGWGNWGIGNVERIYPGDTITVTAGAGLLPVVITIPDPFTAYASSVTDTVWGQIDALPYARIRVDLYGYGGKDAQTDDSGNYSVTWSNVPRGGEGHVRYETTMDYAQVVMHRRFQTPDLILRVNYGHDWVEGNYEAGHTLWLTVTEENGITIKATAVLTTGVIPWWGGRSGFSTNLGEPWIPHRPDIVPGDWVYGALDNGYTSTARVGTITGNVDTDSDTISGTITADWFTDTLRARCEVWVWNGPPSINFSVNPDGGSYECDFNTVGWDLLPGQDVAVTYAEPGDDNDEVINVFHGPAPNLSVDKYGQGQPAPGGNYVYRIHYHNHGDAAASGVVITDTLPTGMTYITDTSGISPTLDGNRVIWDWGAIEANTHGYFDLFVSVDDSLTPGEHVMNTVDITIPEYDTDPGNNHHEWWTEVVANDTHLNVGKWSWTGDPAPGTEFVYSVNVCNNGSTASSQVTLTDTLHLSTTLRYWWAREPGWTEVFSDAQTLVLSRPTIPGGQCYDVYLRVYLDENAWQGMSISNTAIISASNDLEDTDNQTTWWGNVNNPHTNLYLDKDWGWGQLVPGGTIRYWVRCNNHGNVPVTSPVHITDTLPVSTTFVRSWLHTPGQPPVPITPTTGAGYVVWDVGPLDNGYWAHIEMELKVDNDAQPGTVLTNTAEVDRQPVEDNYDDNVDTWVETLFDHGPNLRVRKDGYWHNWGSGTRQIEYNLAVENIGDRRVNWVTITDTYPSEMYMNGGIGFNPGRWWDWRNDPANHTFTATFEYMNPGDSFRFNAYFITDTIPIPPGLVLTNTVEVMEAPSEVTYADNIAYKVLTTGPDLYVEKTLVDGEFLPGQVITFSLRFGNDREGWQWWWGMQGNAWVTDTLPAELEFITATRRSWGWAPFTPDVDDGTHIAWNVGGLCAGCWDEIYLTVRITDTVEDTDLFTNQVEIASDQPISDTEPYYDNNRDDYTVLMVLPRFEVGKVYESSGVAGMPVTYTLTVTNSGNLTGTNVVLSDTLPTGLTYGGSDGTQVGNDIVWTFGSIASNGGTASGWFSGTLPCTTGPITNADYLVVSSDQGVSSAPGAPVAFDVIAPTINAGITRDPATVVVGQMVYFTATASTDGTPLSYAWAFGDGATEVGGLTASHVYTRAGVYTAIFTATDGCGYTGVAMATVTVGKADTTTTITADAPDPSVVGQSVTVSVTVAAAAPGSGTPTGVVSVTTNGGGNPTCNVTLSDGSGACNLVFTSAGAVVITATYAGDANFNGSSDTETHTVDKAGTTTSITADDPDPSVVGQSVTVSVIVAAAAPGSGTPTGVVNVTTTGGGNPTCSVTLSGGSGSCNLTFTAAGAVTITATYAGDANFNGSSDTEEHEVSLGCTALTSVTFTYAPSQPLVHSPVVFTATYAPADATQPVTYTWDFGDGITATVTSATVQHTYAITGTRTVSVTAYNPCTPGGVGHQESITIAPRRIYLPLVLRLYASP